MMLLEGLKIIGVICVKIRRVQMLVTVVNLEVLGYRDRAVVLYLDVLITRRTVSVMNGIEIRKLRIDELARYQSGVADGQRGEAQLKRVVES